jgi:ankyrin repeat protein
VSDGRGRTAFDAANEVADPRERDAVRRALFLRHYTEEPAGPAPWTLEYTVMHGQTGVTKMLLSMGVNPNTVGTRGTTPLSDAALTGNLEDVRLLLQAGAKLDAVSPAGTQPIHDAALGDSAGVIEELAKQGADVNATTREGARTPLHFAAAMGKTNAVQALIALKANLDARDSTGRTPLDAAKSAGHTKIAALLTLR